MCNIKTDPTIPPELSRYHRIFQDKLTELQGFLRAFFSSFFWQWGGGFTVLKAGSAVRLFENPDTFEPFCRHIRESLHFQDVCLQCDARRASEAFLLRHPIDYWCDCGMLDLAAPIIVHGVWVGTILCGQKRLSGPEDNDGLKLLRAWADKNAQGLLIEDLINLRSKTKAVTRDEVETMKRLMGATADYISNILNVAIDQHFGKPDQELGDSLHELLKSLMSLSTTSNIYRLWNDISLPLLTLKELLDFSAIGMLVSEQSGQTRIVSHAALPAPSLVSYAEEALITSQLASFDGPRHLLTYPGPVSCPFSKAVLAERSDISLIVYERAVLPKSRTMHLIVFFSSDSHRSNGLYLHQTKEILSRVLLATITVFLHLERVQELKGHLREKEAFLQDISHHTNQTLQSIVAGCELIAEVHCLPDQAERNLRYIKENALRGSILTAGVVLASRPGKTITLCPEKQRSWHDFSQLLREHVIDIQGYSEQNHIHIHIDTDTTNGIGQLFLDLSAFTIVLTNLLYNAVKYSFHNTTINLSAVSKPATASFELRIVNRGIEIPPERWQTIFRRGERTSQAVRYSQAGLGLGLFISKAILNAMSGDLRVESCTPTGNEIRGFQECDTTFLLTLPTSILRQNH